MKIGIITFQNAHNWGAILQALALKTFLQKKGYTVQIINYINPIIQSNYLRKEKVKLNYNGLKSILKYVYHKVQNVYQAKQLAEKWDSFNDFIISSILDNNITIYTKEKIEEENFDIIIYGSDQIWNPELTGGLDDAYLGVQNKKAKKISYAASMGLDCLSKEDENSFKKYLTNFNNISVREEKLKKYIEKITDREAKVVVDPTLLLEREDYLKIAKSTPRKKYLLVYEISRDKKLINIAKRIAKEKKLEIVCLEYKKDIRRFIYKQVANVGPAEFIGLINNAEFIVTNSFHGTVFSVILEKEFYTIPINKVNSRIDNFLKITKLENRIITKLEQVNLKDNIDFLQAKQGINKYRKESMLFLKDSIEGEK